MLTLAVTGMGRVAFHGQVIRKDAIQIPNHQEPDDGRLSRPVPWERRGEVPLRDPITPFSKPPIHYLTWARHFAQEHLNPTSSRGR